MNAFINKIIKVLPFITGLSFLATSCNNNSTPGGEKVEVNLVYTMLDIDNKVAVKNETYITHFNVLDKYKDEYLIPSKLASITVGSTSLIATVDYTFTNGTLTINKNKVIDKIKIVADARPIKGEISINSSSLFLSDNVVKKGTPIFINYDKSKYGEHYSLPHTLTSVNMGGIYLKQDIDYTYTYDYNIGVFTLIVDYESPIVIKAELSVSHAIKVNSTLGENIVELSSSYKRIETSDTLVHFTDIKLKENCLLSHIISDNGIQPTIKLGNETIICSTYEVNEDLTSATICYALPLVPFVEDDKDLTIIIPVTEQIDPHLINIDSSEAGGNLEIKNKIAVISKSKGIEIIVGYVSNQNKYAVVPDEGYSAFIACLTDENDVQVDSVSCKIKNGCFAFTFDKLKDDTIFASDNMTLHTHLNESNFNELKQVKATIKNAINSDKVIFEFGFGGIGASSLDCHLCIAPIGGYLIKDNLTNREINTILLNAHDTSAPSVPDYHNIQEHEINISSVKHTKNLIDIVLNLRFNYTSIDGYPTLIFHQLNNLLVKDL